MNQGKNVGFNFFQVRCAHKSGDVINFIILACRISSRLKWYKNYKNRLRLATVIVKNKMSRFLWFTVYKRIQRIRGIFHVMRYVNVRFTTFTFTSVAEKALRYFPDITQCHSLGFFKHTRPVYKPIFAEFRKGARRSPPWIRPWQLYRSETIVSSPLTA